ncbi:hypothetical protein Srubr_13830 [Streptomyces rubradiris]|uniref:Uncharacterized protein n=1 Tax=Streptomyces rubradiris TaxID=285531 RepID=A0ABQ3R6Q8_STRRR|nr:hypothetical protein GCM10018792_63800 [Streptomyces rubradiris]GHI51537.1 hypothetical protein Srubr_13830 [Streptomyces rubradiris]
MPAAGIAEEQIAEDAGGGTVRVCAVGTHRLSRPWAQGRSWYGSFGSRAWRFVSSLRVSTPWFDGFRRREFLAPGEFFPGDSGGTAPDSHRLPLLPPYMAWAVHHVPGRAVNLPLTWDARLC